jgi:hypothetical protein
VVGGLRSASRRRVLAIIGVVLGLHLAAPARADRGAVPAPRGGQSLPLPAPGSERLIRIGPEVDVIEDDHGRFRMADTSEPKRSPGRTMITVLFGVVAAGAVLTLGRNELTSDVGGRAPGPP